MNSKQPEETPQKTWHVSFKKVDAHKPNKLSFDELYANRTETSPTVDMKLDAFTGAVKVTRDYDTTEYTYENQ